MVGQINIFGFSLGVGAVLFVGLAIGAFAPKAQIAGPIGLIGLIMFLYGIGILYGRQFFEGMMPAPAADTICWRSLPWFSVLRRAWPGARFNIDVGHTLGLFAGSMTSTATLQAALDVMRNSQPSIGYSVAYPFGVIGPILCIYFMTRSIKPKFPAKEPKAHLGEISLGPGWAARTFDDVKRDLPGSIQVTMVRRRASTSFHPPI